jgi:plastocyanin
MLLLGVLCLVSSAAATVAIAAPGHHSVHTVHACRHVKHHHCRRHPIGKQLHRKHKLGAPEPSPPKNTGTTSLTAPPTAVTPGVGSAGSGGGDTSPGATPSAPPATEPPVAPVGPAHVQVTAEDSDGYHFILSRASVPAGQVVIEFVNHGEDEHNLNVKPGEGPVEGALPNTAPKAHPSLSLDLRAGSYTLFCSLPGHEAKGMKATLTVE